MSLRVITSSEGGNFSSRTLCLSLTVQDVGPSVGFDVKQQSPQRHCKYSLRSWNDWSKFESCYTAIQRPVTNCEFGKLRRKRRQNCKYLVSTTVMVRLEPGNSGGRMRGNYEMGNEDKLRLKFAVVIVFFNPLTLRSNLCFFTLSTIQFL